MSKLQLRLFLLAALVTSVPSAKAAPAPQRAGFYFEYESVDGQFHLDCEHKALAQDSGDWQVACGRGTVHERNFGVHLVIRKHSRAVEPRMAVEILYFVTDRRSPNDSRFTSHVTWLTFKQEADFHSIRLSQSVDNDYAYLTMNLGN